MALSTPQAWLLTLCVGVFATTARSPEIAQALHELLSPGGPSIVLCGVEAYHSDLSTPVSFHTLSSTAQAREEVLLGWRESSKDGGQLTLNPSDKAQKRTFEAADDLVVVRKEDSPYVHHPSML